MNLRENKFERGGGPIRSLALVICDLVIEDARTRNKSLIGIFNRIHMPRLPSVYPRFFIFSSLTGGSGKTELVLRLLHVDSGTTVFETRGELMFEHPDSVVDIIFDIAALTFQQEGQYSVEILAGTKIVTDRDFTLTVGPPPEPVSSSESHPADQGPPAD